MRPSREQVWLSIALLIGGAALALTITDAVRTFQHNNQVLTDLTAAVNGR